MRLLGNVIWFICGGFIDALLWWAFGILAFISILGIPWGRACFVMGTFALFPFGKMPIRRDVLTGKQDIGTGCLGTVGNIIWFLFAGIWIAIAHVLSAVACTITIIGIPFAWQHLKLAGLALSPIGMTVVPAEIVNLAEQQNAADRLNEYRK